MNMRSLYARALAWAQCVPRLPTIEWCIRTYWNAMRVRVKCRLDFYIIWMYGVHGWEHQAAKYMASLLCFFFALLRFAFIYYFSSFSSFHFVSFQFFVSLFASVQAHAAQMRARICGVAWWCVCVCATQVCADYLSVRTHGGRACVLVSEWESVVFNRPTLKMMIERCVWCAQCCHIGRKFRIHTKWPSEQIHCRKFHGSHKKSPLLQ